MKSRKRRTAGTMPRRDTKTACTMPAGEPQPGSTGRSVPATMWSGSSVMPRPWTAANFSVSRSSAV